MTRIIRLAEQKDISELTILFNSDTRIFGEDATGFGERDVAEYVQDGRKKVFVCESDGRLSGALMADYHDSYSHLETLIVDPRAQQQGVGTALLEHYEKDVDTLGITLIEVMTATDNTVMQKILEERGFNKGNTFVFYSRWRK
jgi:ribosomal protein S18 acetylase RimI-like enzyme